MLDGLNRRDFGRHASLALGGGVGAFFTSQLPAVNFLAGELDGAELAAANERLLLLGLNGLARAHQMNYFADGHRGASLIAAHLMCADNNFDERARARIVELFDLNWANSPLCADFPEEDPDPEGIKRIGEALIGGGEVLRQVGHNAIFAMLAIKGFRMLPRAATPQRIDGVCKMINAFTPWRDVPPDKDVQPPPFSDAPAASRFVLREASESIDRFIGFGQGFAGHMLTFGQALIELAAMGDEEWANGCRTAFCKYVTVTRRGPEPDSKRYADHKPTKLRPVDTEYWVKRGDRTLGIGHVFKYPYSYYDLLKRADDDQLAREWNDKAYHVF